MAGTGVMPPRAVPCRAVTPARCHPALPVGAVPVQQEPVVKPGFHGASTATAPPSRSSEVSSLPASSIRPRQSWFLSWGRLDVAPEPAPCRPAVAPASCLLCPAPLIPAAHPATRTGSCRATPSHPTAAFTRHPAPLGDRDTAAGQPGAWGGCPGAGTGRCAPSCWTSSHPQALPVLPPLCLSFPFTRGWGGRSGSRHPVASPCGSGRLLGAFPLCLSPRAGLGDHPRGGHRWSWDPLPPAPSLVFPLPFSGQTH